MRKYLVIIQNMRERESFRKRTLTNHSKSKRKVSNSKIQNSNKIIQKEDHAIEKSFKPMRERKYPKWDLYTKTSKRDGKSERKTSIRDAKKREMQKEYSKIQDNSKSMSKDTHK